MGAPELQELRWKTFGPAGEPQTRTCPHVGYGGRLMTCKRRDCRRCGRPWARSWESVLRHNLAHFGREVVLVTVTAPGADLLPWSCGRQHKHAGDKGCRVKEDAADAWAEGARENWQHLRGAARKAALAALPEGARPFILVRTWEPQKRGVPHVHLVLAFGTELERIAARRFVDELARLAPEYSFGFVDRHLEPISAREASSYLAGYLLGRSGRKETVRENIADPRMPRSLIWVTPALTSPSGRYNKARRILGVAGCTFVTMRRLRTVRWYFAVLAGRCEIRPQVWKGRHTVARVAALLEPVRARPPNEDDERRFRRHLRNLELMCFFPTPTAVAA